MLDLPTDLPADLAPLSWLIGVWEGTGVIDYTVGDHRYQGEFSHRVSFSHDGGPFLNYSATASFLGREGADAPVPLIAETGYWRLARPSTASEPGPALLPAIEAGPDRTVDDVETLRTPEGFPLEASIAHSDGTLEHYRGRVDGPRIDLTADTILRAEGTADYTAASRMYGLVDSHLLWAWDIAAAGSPLASHASARLARA